MRMHADDGPEKLSRVGNKNYHAPSVEMRPSQRHDIYEELLQKQKEFASIIYLQRDQDRRDF